MSQACNHTKQQQTYNISNYMYNSLVSPILLLSNKRRRAQEKRKTKSELLILRRQDGDRSKERWLDLLDRSSENGSQIY